MTEPKLPGRLEKILAAAGKCRCLADIGTDHGLLPIAALLRGMAKRAVASDLRKAPMEICARNFETYGVSDRARLAVGNGFDVLLPGEADAVSICGMGGINVCEIILKGISDGKVPGKTRFVLSPNSHEEYVRRLLYCGSFEKIREKALRDNGFVYIVFSCVYTGRAPEGDYLSKGFDEPVLFRPEDYTGYREAGVNNSAASVNDRMLPKYYYRKVLQKAEKRLRGLEKTSGLSNEEILMGKVAEQAGRLLSGLSS